MKFLTLLAALMLVLILGPSRAVHGQCSSGACARPSYAPAPTIIYQAPVAPLYGQYGGSGRVYYHADRAFLNAWLILNDPARPLPRPKPTAKPCHEPAAVKPCECPSICPEPERCAKPKADPNLNVVDEKSGLSISTFDYRGSAGLYVQRHPDENVGLVYQKDVGPHLVIWEKHDKVPFAISHKGIQLPSKRFNDVKFISWERLYKAVELLIPPEAE